MLDYFQHYNTRMITGSSVLFIVDNVSKSFDMRIIDLSHFVDLEESTQRDQGYIIGLTNILKILNELD